MKIVQKTNFASFLTSQEETTQVNGHEVDRLIIIIICLMEYNIVRIHWLHKSKGLSKYTVVPTPLFFS